MRVLKNIQQNNNNNKTTEPRHYVPKKQVKAKKGKHDDDVANYPCGVTYLVQQEEPFIYKPVQRHKKHMNYIIYIIDNTFKSVQVTTSTQSSFFFIKSCKCNNWQFCMGYMLIEEIDK